MTPDEFQSRWRSLPLPRLDSQFEAAEVAAGSGVWIARDYANRAHLLVEVPDDVVIDVEGTHGLGVSLARHRIVDHPDSQHIDLVCLDPAVAPTFAVVAADVAAEAVGSALGTRRDGVVAVLDEWRWFWSIDPNRLSGTDAVGLFGELWFLIRWVGVSADSVGAWTASSGARHDFQWPMRSVEVKTTSQSGAVIHTIQNLEQLDDAETGELYLFSLQLARDSLAVNSLNSLVNIVTAAMVADAGARAELLRKLSQRGYTPAAHEHASTSYRIIREELYRVAGAFPRLTRSAFSGGVPDGITKISYQLDMNACTAWRVDRDAIEW